jgi:hypothetical protein
MLLFNHRSWADFFVHDIIADSTASFLARKLVGVIFPLVYFSSFATRGLWFFNRGSAGRSEEEREQSRIK